MKLHPSHKEILAEIVRKSGKATQHTFLETYLGNKHARYPISAPVLRRIAKTWADENRSFSSDEFCHVVSSLIHGPSFTEKAMGGILLDYAKPSQRKFEIDVFDDWLEQLEGWAEIDALCTGKFSLHEVPTNFKKWKSFLRKLSKSKLIGKRRASLVFYCSPISHCEDDDVAFAAIKNIETLQGEKDILITKAISWLLRSMIRYHREKVEKCLEENALSLPAIAIRETRIKLDTGKKGGARK